MDYFPGVLQALQSLAGVPVRAVPDPIYTAAVGAALMSLRQGEVS